ncbi:SAM-dependent methyltransferase, partial [Actinoplanes sp. NPDC089786]|uniref:SAM-dependent methyltransferase n=1 Tax=Actinoplanes sp. NPDC089786 TaxID=3155185 RepID=UPI003440A8D1
QAEPAPLIERVRLVGVEKAARPDGLNARISWRSTLPDQVTGAILATEWLDNVPLDVAEMDAAGRLRRVLVDAGTGEETAGPAVGADDRLWCARWWPDPRPGERVEIGWTRDAAWSEAVGALRKGVALAVDYGHRKGERPRHGTLTGFRGGRQVAPVPDGSCDVTAHVAMDAVAIAGGWPYTLITQREALRALGVDGARPPLDLASRDPAAYLRALSGAGAAAELTDPDGLGGHWWLLQSVGLGENERGRLPQSGGLGEGAVGLQESARGTMLG